MNFMRMRRLILSVKCLFGFHKWYLDYPGKKTIHCAFCNRRTLNIQD